MGYCIYLEESNLKIKKDNMDKILNTLSDFFEGGESLRWVNGFNIEDMIPENEYDKPLTLEEIWDDLRYIIKEDGDYYIIDEFDGEKLGDDLKLFQLIAKYCENGYLQFCGEDGDHFRIVIKDGEAYEKWAELSWE